MKKIISVLIITGLLFSIGLNCYGNTFEKEELSFTTTGGEPYVEIEAQCSLSELFMKESVGFKLMCQNLTDTDKIILSNNGEDIAELANGTETFEVSALYGKNCIRVDVIQNGKIIAQSSEIEFTASGYCEGKKYYTLDFDKNTNTSGFSFINQAGSIITYAMGDEHGNVKKIDGQARISTPSFGSVLPEILSFRDSRYFEKTIGSSINFMPLKYNNTQWSTTLKITPNGLTYTYGSESYVFCEPLRTGEWYDFRVDYNLANTTLCIFVNDKLVLKNKKFASSVSSVAYIEVGSPEGYFWYVDNFECIFMGEKRTALLGFVENLQTSYETDNVTFGETTLKLDFSGVMDKATLNSENIQIYTDKGIAVFYEGEAEDNAYKMLTPNGILMPNREYYVSVSSDVQSISGVPLEGKEFAFKTRKTDFSINTFSINGDAALKDCADNSVIEISIALNNRKNIGFSGILLAQLVKENSVFCTNIVNISNEEGLSYCIHLKTADNMKSGEYKINLYLLDSLEGMNIIDELSQV